MKKLILLFWFFLLIFQCEVFSQGSGADGALSVPSSTTTINTVASTVTATASSGQQVVKVASSTGFASPNLVLVIQMLGTNVGVWEVATVSSTTASSITMVANLKNTYTKSSSTSLAQVIKIPQYTNVTISSGATLAAPAWNGNTGGVLVFYSNGTLTVSGAINMNANGYRGGTGAVGVAGPASGGLGGANVAPGCTNGDDGVITGSGTAGGACGCSNGGRGGVAGLQTGASGSAGEGPAGGTGGAGTGAVGGDNFTACWTGNCSVIQMGGGGGGGKAGDVSIPGGGGSGGSAADAWGSAGNTPGQSAAGGNGGNGGIGGGIIMITANIFTGAATGAISVNGGNGTNGTAGGNGMDGGNGGNGGNGTGTYGGAGAGGAGANGSEGGGAGAFGAGGSVYLMRTTNTYSGTVTVAHGSHGTVGSGGSNGNGGLGGTNGCGGTAPNGTSGSSGSNGDNGVNPSGGGGGDITLPISLLSFKAVKQGSYVSLLWVTATEINNNYFTIEKSANAGEWVKVADVKGAGNSTVKKYYYFADTDPFSGVSYYRLKQVDYNGEFAYSNIAVVDFNSADESFLNVLPTLSSGDFEISVAGQKDKQVLIEIQNMMGQKYYSEKLNVDNDIFVLPLQLSGVLPSGIYMIIATCNGRTFSKKVVVR